MDRLLAKRRLAKKMGYVRQQLVKEIIQKNLSKLEVVNERPGKEEDRPPVPLDLLESLDGHDLRGDSGLESMENVEMLTARLESMLRRRSSSADELLRLPTLLAEELDEFHADSGEDPGRLAPAKEPVIERQDVS